MYLVLRKGSACGQLRATPIRDAPLVNFKVEVASYEENEENSVVETLSAKVRVYIERRG